MKRVVVPTEIQPGDVYLSHVDQEPHWVDEVFITTAALDVCRYREVDDGFVAEDGQVEEPVVVLACEGGARSIQVHHLELPVLIQRPEAQL